MCDYYLNIADQIFAGPEGVVPKDVPDRELFSLLSDLLDARYYDLPSLRGLRKRAWLDDHAIPVLMHNSSLHFLVNVCASKA